MREIEGLNATAIRYEFLQNESLNSADLKASHLEIEDAGPLQRFHQVIQNN
jgi:hypothetical protein